ncbi:MAG: phage tail tip lysozyme [Terracidiphilus sp.]
MASISGSVGQGGRNHRADVLTVQRLINAKLPAGLAPLVEDGVCGHKTAFAIAEYQRRNLHMNPTDSRVDPHGATFRSLTGGSSHPVHAAARPAPALPVPAGNTRGAMDYFIAQGWTAAQAAGIVANLLAESGLRPDAGGDGGQAYGVAQWHADRQANFQRFTGRAIQGSTVDQQLRFVQHELSSTEVGAAHSLRNATSASDAGATMSRRYERPADREGEATRRGQRAQQILDNYTSQH